MEYTGPEDGFLIPKVQKMRSLEKDDLIVSQKDWGSLTSIFKKAKIMMRYELLVFLEPSEIIKTCLLCKTINESVNENKF